MKRPGLLSTVKSVFKGLDESYDSTDRLSENRFFLALSFVLGGSDETVVLPIESSYQISYTVPCVCHIPLYLHCSNAITLVPHFVSQIRFLRFSIVKRHGIKPQLLHISLDSQHQGPISPNQLIACYSVRIVVQLHDSLK